MIYIQIIDELLQQQDFIDLRERLKTKGKDIHSANAKDFEDVVTNINLAVEEAIRERPILQGLVRQDLKESTLVDCFDHNDHSDNEEKRRDKTINSLLVYLGYKDPNLWPPYKKEIPNYKLYSFDESKLIGIWYLYRLDKGEVKRTTLHIERFIGRLLKASYRSIHETPYYNGKIDEAGKLLLIFFKDKQQAIEIRAQIDDSILTKGRLIHALITSSTEGNIPMSRHLIMQYSNIGKNYNGWKGIEKEEVKIISHSSLQKKEKSEDNTDVNIPSKDTEILDSIVEFLHNNSETLYAPPITPSNLKGLQNLNEEYFTKHDFGFQILKEQLIGQFISLSRIETDTRQISVFTWKFNLIYASHKCIAIRERQGKQKTIFEGPVILQNNKYIFDLKEKNSSRSKRLVGQLLDRTTAYKILGLSLTETNSGLETVVREILIKIDDSINEYDKAILIQSKNGCISYDDFLKLECLSFDEKILFNSRAESTITNPVYIKHSDVALKPLDSRLQAAEKYEGEYYAYLINAYENDSLLRIIITIDQLGQVIEKFTLKPYHEDKQGKGKDVFTYYGQARIVNRTLRLSNQDQRQLPRSEYSFEIYPVDFDEIESVLEGVVMDTDKNGYPCVGRCLLVRKDELPELPFLPNIVTEKDAEYQSLNDFIRQRLPKTPSIKAFFFTPYPQSLRKRL